MEERSPKLSVKVRNLYNGEHGKLRAVLSVTIGGAYAIHGLKLYETEKGGLFLSMPSQSYEADGETKYTQIFHPITARGREYLRRRHIWPTTWPWRARSRKNGWGWSCSRKGRLKKCWTYAKSWVYCLA